MNMAINKIRQKGQRGVAYYFFILIVGVMLGFVMLVINTGMLVYQKMRLQSAVDLAAYAGASVQAAYLGTEGSGEQSIHGINSKILKRYGKLLQDLKFGNATAWPIGFPDPFSCAAACAAASLANGQRAVSIYKSAVADMEDYRAEAIRIMMSLPKASQEAAQATIGINIPDLAIEEDGAFAGLSDGPTGDVQQAIKNSKETDSNPFNSKSKNAVLTFSSEKGLYLANVVAPAPHLFAYYGPMCFDAYADQDRPDRFFYCAVNGQGAPGGAKGFQAAQLAFGKVYAPIANGNIGNISKMSDPKANAIRLHFIQNVHRPKPFVVVSAEWWPENGSFANLENSLGAKGSLFPKKTRLVAVAAAEPFGGSLYLSDHANFGTRLQGIRKLLLDPRILSVEGDYPHLFEYFETLGPRDDEGMPIESGRETVRRFLH